jgi:hypothetical protein
MNQITTTATPGGSHGRFPRRLRGRVISSAGPAGGRRRISVRQIMTLIGLRARRLVAAALAMAAAVLAVAVASGAPASAATSAVTVGSITCSGNALTVYAPTMYRVQDDGVNENAWWQPQLQEYETIGHTTGWVTVAYAYGTNLYGVISGNLPASGWVNGNGASIYGSITWHNLTPGYSYRVVNFVEWVADYSAMLNGWYGPYTSTWYSNPSYTWCKF